MNKILPLNCEPVITNSSESFIEEFLIKKPTTLKGINGENIVAPTKKKQPLTNVVQLFSKTENSKSKLNKPKKGLEASLNFLLDENSSFETGLYNVLNGHSKKVLDKNRDLAKDHWLWIQENNDKKDSRFNSISNYLSSQISSLDSSNLEISKLNERIENLTKVYDIMSNYSYFNKKINIESQFNPENIKKSENFSNGLNEIKTKIELLIGKYKEKLKGNQLEFKRNLANEFSHFLQENVPNFKKKNLEITSDGRIINSTNFASNFLNKIRYGQTLENELLETTLNVFNNISENKPLSNSLFENLSSGYNFRLREFLKGGMPHSSLTFSYSHLIIGLN